jgi:hypothetical protein
MMNLQIIKSFARSIANFFAGIRPKTYAQIFLGSAGLLLSFQANKIYQAQRDANDIMAELAKNQNTLLVFQNRPKLTLEYTFDNEAPTSAHDYVFTITNNGEAAKRVHVEWIPTLHARCRINFRNDANTPWEFIEIPMLGHVASPTDQDILEKFGTINIVDRKSFGFRGDNENWSKILSSLDWKGSKIEYVSFTTKIKVAFEDLLGTSYTNYYDAYTEKNSKIPGFLRMGQSGWNEFLSDYDKLYKGEGNDGAGIEIGGEDNLNTISSIIDQWGQPCIAPEYRHAIYN